MPTDDTPFADVQKFCEALAQMNAVSNQHTLQIIQMVTLATQVKSLTELDISQAVIESKMAQQLNTTERIRRAMAPAQPKE